MYSAKLFCMIMGIGLFVGCASVQRGKEITDISCRYFFNDIDRAEDQNRIDKSIRSIAKGLVIRTGTITNPEYQFFVENLRSLDEIHPKILFKKTSKMSIEEQQQTLDSKNARFEITYYSTDITASIKVLLSFRIKPGSQLFYKDQGGSEVDITSNVNSSGEVTLRTKIKKGQEFIFARTVLNKVSRFIKIDVYTQLVTDIDEIEYK